MITRRECLGLLLAAPFASARAQTARTARVAWVSVDPQTANFPFLAAFRTGMRSVGRSEGPGLVIDTWWGGGSVAGVRKLMPEILASRPDVIVAAGGGALPPFIEANVPVPVVFTFSGDVVAGKVVQSWARPGVNRTGVSFYSLDIVPKRLAVLKEILPAMRRVAFIGWPPHAGEIQELETA